MPVLADFLKSIEARNEARLLEATAQLQTTIAAQSSQLQAILSTGLTVQVQAAVPAALQAAVPSALQREGSHYASACSSLGSRSPSPAHCLDSANRSGPGPELEPGPDPPGHRMCRTTKTVEGLWREWTVGLRGQPAIIELDRQWGHRWRSGRQSELQWYSLRLEVVKEIQRVAQAQRTSEEAAMHIVDLHQRQTGCSIDQLCKRLRANRKARLVGYKTR